MRIFQWIFPISLAVFLGVVVTAQQGPGGTTDTLSQPPCNLPGAPAMTTVATDTTGPTTPSSNKAYVKDVMNYMMMPSAAGVWNAVATVTDQTGVHEFRPKTEDDWNRVIAAATELAETPNLVMMAGRKRCVGGEIPAAFKTDFARKAREITEAANIALIAAKKHDADALAEAGERIDVACDECHEKYQLLDDDPDNNNNKVWGTWKPKPGSKPAKPAVPGATAAASPAAPKAAPATPKKG